MNRIIPVLAAAALVLGLYYHSTQKELAALRTQLAASNAVNEANQQAISRLEHGVQITENVMEQWNTDRTTIAQMRKDTTQAIKEAMRDATFITWAADSVPDTAWRLLHNTPNSDNTNGSSGLIPSWGVDGGLSGNTFPKQWD